MKTFRFIHAADLHIGTPFRGLARLNEEAAAILRESTYRAFDAMVEYAVNKDVDFLLLCGDLVDIEDRNLRPFLHMERGFRRLREHDIGVFIVHGNHDPAEGVSGTFRFPENVVAFPTEASQWRRFNTRSGGIAVAIWGMSFGQRAEYRNLSRLVPPGPDDAFRIVLLHCTVGQQGDHEPYAPCVMSDLKERSVDYWALGHVHKKAQLSEDPVVIYPGNIQGRSFKELGERGCYLVEVNEDHKVKLTFLETGMAVWEEATVDVTGIPDVSELQDRLYQVAKRLIDRAHPRGLICRFRLEGVCAFFEDISTDETLEEMVDELNAEFYDAGQLILVEGIRNCSYPAMDMEKRQEAGDLAAYVLSEAENLQSDFVSLSGEGGALSQLFRDRRIRKLGLKFSQGEIRQLIRSAKHLLIHFLEHPEK